MNDLLQRHPQIVVGPRATLRDAMAAMTDARLGIVLAVTEKRLVGVLTDIDMRKALLAGVGLEAPVSKIMNRSPLTIREGLAPEQISEFFRANLKSHIPIVDARGRLKGLAAFIDYAQIPRRYPNWIVLMAGGAGKRLRPLTETTPKPLLRVGDKPILELLLEQLVASGFGHFILTVNYLADKVRAHFGDGSRWGCQIEYVQESETKPLGTVGSLSLIKRRFDAPVIVANGDILTKINFNALLDFHKAEKGLATICVKSHEIQVPYGVIELSDHRMRRFTEKPTHRFLVNAGIYVLEPAALAMIPRGKPCDMPTLLETIRRKNRRGVACFPIQEYWLDIGGMQEYQRAAVDYDQLFRAQ